MACRRKLSRDLRCYDRGTVTLMAYAYQPVLKTDAVRAVKRVPGVDEVKDRIEVLPPSPNDDELRWKIYYAIYRDPFLSRYAPGGALLWGHRHPFGTGLVLDVLMPGLSGLDCQRQLAEAGYTFV